jgi:hypothetical protein
MKENSGNHIEAELDTTTDVAFSASGDREKTVILKPVGGPSFDFDWLFSPASDGRWKIDLSPELPLDLRVNAGLGAATRNRKVAPFCLLCYRAQDGG